MKPGIRQDNMVEITDTDMEELTLLRKIFLHVNAEKFEGVYFICGEGGDKDSHGLPDTILVCPAIGADQRATVAYSKKL